MTTESPMARFILGVILIILLDTIGAFYAFVGFILAKETSYPETALYTGLLGMFDGTIGLKLSIYCKAYMGLSDEQLAKMQSAKTAVMMIVMGIAVGSLLSDPVEAIVYYVDCFKTLLRSCRKVAVASLNPSIIKPRNGNSSTD